MRYIAAMEGFEIYTEVKRHHLRRILWMVVNATVFRLLIGFRLRWVRNALLRIFGASVPDNSLVYSSVTIYAPWNLSMGEHCCIGPRTRVYNKDFIKLGNHCIVSQDTTLSTAGHDISSYLFELTKAPIVLHNHSWVASEAFVGMGVTIGEGAVVGARAAVFKDVDPWTVVGGNPAKFIKKRIIKE